MKTRFRYFSHFGLIGFFIIFTCLGCANIAQKFDKWQTSFTETVKETLNFSDSESSTAAEKKNGDVYFVHTSRYSWETLGIVADWYTDDSKNQKVLAEINPDVDPKKIKTGSEIFIPVRLLKTRKPLPQNFASDYCKNCYRHTVRWTGESLSLIARWYTGASGNWRELAKANPRINPHRIKKGNVIIIPPALLKTKKPLPQNFASAYCKNCYRHTVRWTGESLSLIARWYTGSYGNWRKLAKANPRINPHRIKKGNVIMIPPALLKTKKPLPQKVAAKYTANYFAHTVKQDGEKMEVIASWYTGNPANWKAIGRANPKLNLERLMAGNEIYIPSKLLKTRQPIPTLQSSPSVTKSKTKPPAVERKITPVEEEIKIFGPKQFPKS